MRLTLKQLLRRLTGLKGRTLVTGHSQADMDAVASSLVLAELLPRAQARVIDHARTSARKVLKELHLELPLLRDVAGTVPFENLILVDVSNADMLGTFSRSLPAFSKIVCIDHHEHNKPLDAPRYVDAERTSCSEVVYQISKALGKKLSGKQATLLACGLLEDSALLKSANAKTIETLSELLKTSGRELSELVSWLVAAPSVNEREEALEALAQTSIERIGETLLAVAKVPAFESRVAALLVQSGADLAVAYNPKAGKISMLKSRSDTLRKLDVGKLLGRTAGELRGFGGGHAFIGGLRVTPSKTSEAAKYALCEARKILEPERKARRKQGPAWDRQPHR